MNQHPEDKQTKYPYGYGLSKIELWGIYLRKANAGNLILGLYFLGFAIMCLLALIRHYTKFLSDFDGLVIAISFFLWGVGGFVKAYRRFNQFTMISPIKANVSIMRNAAFWEGLLMMICSWGLALYALITTLINIFHR